MKRCTINLAETSSDVTFIATVVNASTDAHQVLASLVPDEPLNSESAVLRALMQIGRRAVEEQALQVQYDRAMDAGEFDDESRAMMHHARLNTNRLWSEA